MVSLQVTIILSLLLVERDRRAGWRGSEGKRSGVGERSVEGGWRNSGRGKLGAFSFRFVQPIGNYFQILNLILALN